MTGRKCHVVVDADDYDEDDDDEDEDDQNKENSDWKRKGASAASKRKYTLTRRKVSSGNQKLLNIEEKNNFMQGVKKVAIISDAASCGISLHSCVKVFKGLLLSHIFYIIHHRVKISVSCKNNLLIKKKKIDILLVL